ncbi:MAG: HAMP domain-containing histidine kinase [Elusimicrobia bacterium]|nr:HAMP domain-containing histidine kinase [Elusimicrobiota bacterium]
MNFQGGSRTQARCEDLVVRPKAPEQAPGAVKPAPKDPEQQLASYMTHELRAPLTSIRSALAILHEQLNSRLAADERQVMTLALKNAERLNSLINDILDFEKIRAGKMTVTLEALRPEELMAEAADSMRAWAVAKGLRLVCAEPEEPLPRVLADRKRTVQVLVNLLSNAIKFTPAGGKVEICAACGRHEHLGTISFKVKDSGPGIPHADLERIFRCFEQSALGMKASQGTGLGLTLAKAMIELQGGRIWAESWKGLGATFVFTLPIVQSDMARPVKAYPKPAEFHGLLVNVFRRLNAVVAALFA